MTDDLMMRAKRAIEENKAREASARPKMEHQWGCPTAHGGAEQHCQCVKAATEAATLRGLLEELLETNELLRKLTRFACHDNWCVARLYGPSKECSCGYTEAITALREKKQ